MAPGRVHVSVSPFSMSNMVRHLDLPSTVRCTIHSIHRGTGFERHADVFGEILGSLVQFPLRQHGAHGELSFSSRLLAILLRD